MMVKFLLVLFISLPSNPKNPQSFLPDIYYRS